MLVRKIWVHITFLGSDFFFDREKKIGSGKTAGSITHFESGKIMGQEKNLDEIYFGVTPGDHKMGHVCQWQAATAWTNKLKS